MTQRRELPENIRAAVDSLLHRAGEQARAKEVARAEPLLLQAWEILPEPKLGWEFDSNVMPRNFFLFYRDGKQFEKPLNWLDVAREPYASSGMIPWSFWRRRSGSKLENSIVRSKSSIDNTRRSKRGRFRTKIRDI